MERFRNSQSSRGQDTRLEEKEKEVVEYRSKIKSLEIELETAKK